jgi:hypothetical protein
MRDLAAALIAPTLKATGFRFSKDYRWGTTWYHRAVYRLVNVVLANLKAEGNA